MAPAQAQAQPEDVEEQMQTPLKGRVSAINKWALLRKGDRMVAMFQFDQLKMRYEYAIRREFLPKASWWKKKSIKKDIERLFDDVNEEIYYQEQLSKYVKGKEALKKKILARAQTEKEKLEEVLAGYDKFTVEEEKKIAEMTKAAVQKMIKSEKATGLA